MNPAPYLLAWFAGLASHRWTCPSMMKSSSPASVLNTVSPSLVKVSRPPDGPHRDRSRSGWRHRRARRGVIARARYAAGRLRWEGPGHTILPTWDVLRLVSPPPYTDAWVMSIPPTNLTPLPGVCGPAAQH